MAVRCAKCGEELLGAVNRCWKCGATFAARPEIDGRPPVMVEMPPAEAATVAAQPLDAVVLDELPTSSEMPVAPIVAVEAPAPSPSASPAAYVPPPQPPMATVLLKPRLVPRSSSPADRVEAIRSSNMAMGGTVGAVVLGAFALALSPFRFEAALIAALGLVMGIWGLSSPRRNWALAAMLLCCLAIGVGAYTGVKQLYFYLQRNRPVEVQEPDSSTAVP